MTTSRATTIAQETARGLQTTLPTYMTDSPYRRYFNWALSCNNASYKDFWKLIGLSQLSKMTASLVGGMLNEDEFEQFLPYVVDMNVYQLYEVISDNMAIGLADKQADDKTYMSRRHLLYLFNLIMMDALQNGEMRITPSAGNAEWLARYISGFEQSLNYNAHKKMALAYMQSESDVSLDDLEHHLWHDLGANIQSAIYLCKRIEHHPTYDMFLNTLIARYEATNQLLAEIPLSLDELSTIGTNTILVVPTLVYYIGVLGEIKNLNTKLESVVESGLLHQSLSKAALLVRILNDLGTDIAVAKPEAMHTVSDTLRNLKTVDEFKHRINHHDHMHCFTRIHKDLTFGEFNIGLHDLHRDAGSTNITDILNRNFEFFSNKYQVTRNQLDAELLEITQCLGDPFVQEIILTFVVFHEQLYSNDFRTAGGEYAI